MGDLTSGTSAAMNSPSAIPVVWRIDVEPNAEAAGPALGGEAWDGFLAMRDLVESLRAPIEDRTGQALAVTWFVRADPEIERRFGRADLAMHRFGSDLERMRDAGDKLGVHPHAHRWDADQGVMYSDYLDEDWPVHCLQVAAEVFLAYFGEAVQRSSQGGYFLSERLVDAAVQLGIAVDVSVEPGLRSRTMDRSLGAFASAPSTDFRGFPRRPYFPAVDSIAKPARSLTAARSLLIVPLTSYDHLARSLSIHKRALRKALGRARATPLSPWRPWSSPQAYWDLVERAVDTGPARYCAFATRTDPPESAHFQRVRSLLEYLPHHRIARRLRFVDPLGPEIRVLADGGRVLQ